MIMDTLAHLGRIELGTVLMTTFVAGLPLVGQRTCARRRFRPTTVQVRHQRETRTREPVTQSLALPVTHQMPILSPWGES